MPKLIKLVIKEPYPRLRWEQEKTKNEIKKKKVQMLILMVEWGYHGIKKLANEIGVSPSTIKGWKTKYRNGGLSELLSERDLKNKTISKAAAKDLSDYLTTSYKVYPLIQICALLNKLHSCKISYWNLRKYSEKYLPTQFEIYRNNKKELRKKNFSNRFEK